jgi:hypothetical protein
MARFDPPFAPLPNIAANPPVAPRTVDSHEDSSAQASVLANQSLSIHSTELDAHASINAQAPAPDSSDDTWIDVRFDSENEKLVIKLPPKDSEQFAEFAEQLQRELDEEELDDRSRSLEYQKVGNSVLIYLPIIKGGEDKALDCVKGFLDRLSTQCKFLGIDDHETLARLMKCSHLVEAIGSGALDFEHKFERLGKKAFIIWVTEALNQGITQFTNIAFDELDECIISDSPSPAHIACLDDLAAALSKAAQDALHSKPNDKLLFRLIPFVAKVCKDNRFEILSAFCQRFPDHRELPLSLLSGEDKKTLAARLQK